MSAGEVRAFLARHGLAPSRRRGQNFLVDEALAARLVTLARVEDGASVIEIGTGLGVLTRALAARAGRVVTLEVDAGLVRGLEAEGALPAHVELRHRDVLEMDLRALAAELPPPVRVVANLPYAISSPVLRRLLDLRDRLAGWAVMLQRELAARLLAPVATRDYGSLAVLHHLTVRVERALDLRPGCFHPAPQVVSSFLVVEPLRGDVPDRAELVAIERVARAAFGVRRKTLANALRTGFPDVAPDVVARALAAADLAGDVRAEQVAPEGFRRLARALGATGADAAGVAAAGAASRDGDG